jgi:hypothetical protein
MLRIARALVVLCLAVVLLPASSADARTRRRALRRRQPPIAYYFAEWSKGATRAEAVARCRARRIAERRKHPDMGADVDPRRCDSLVMAVRGPYVRTGTKGGYDDPAIYVYKGRDGVWLDASGDNACFAAGTKVATPEGDRAIETMQRGDALYAWDPDGGRVVVAHVDHAKRRPDKQVGTLAFDDGTSIEATANHPFYSVSTRGWVEAGQLAPGDRVTKLDGGRLHEARLVSATPFDRVTDVFDLSVSPHHNFFAAGVLVHNY